MLRNFTWQYYSIESSTPLNAEQEDDQLQQQNVQLRREIERLETDHCSVVAELVYLQWVNACLRHELREHKPAPGRITARDLKPSLSHTSRDNAMQLLLQYANSTYSEDNSGILANQQEPKLDHVATDCKKSSSSKPKFISKLKGFMTSCKDGKDATKTTITLTSPSTSSSSPHASCHSYFEKGQSSSPSARCKSDLGSPSKNLETGEPSNACRSPERLKLSRFAKALSVQTTIRRSASFTGSV